MPQFNRDSWETRAVSLFGNAMQHASWTACRRTGWWFGLALFKALKGRRKIAISNVRLAFPELSEAAARQVARRSVQNSAMMLFEFMHSATATAAEVRDYVDLEGIEHVFHGLDRGRGVLLLTAHLGNWELMGARAAQDLPVSAVARPSSNQGIEEQIMRVRIHSGMEVISKHDGGRAGIDALKANRALAVLPDQYAGPTGLLLPFFGHPTRMISSVARLAMLSGAPVVPSFGVRRRPWLSDGRIVGCISSGFYVENDRKRRDELVLSGTQRMIEELESVIRRHPDQWLWLHRRWRDESAVNAAVDNAKHESS
jgi:KDO2-lipid IV(A) lauroyltransferase